MNPPNRPPTKTLENDPNELDRFKREIDLVDYAAKFGYSVKKQGPRGDWQQLEKEGENLIVTRKGDHQVYLNPGDDRDKGSVVDFAKTRGGEAGQGLNLGQVRKELREYLGEQQPQREGADRQPAPLARTAAPAIASEDDTTRRSRLISEVLGAERGLTDRTYLHGRQLTDSTIDSPAFQGRIYTAQQNEHKNTAFPLYNERGISSVEQKNEGYKNLLPLPKDGVWVSHPTDPDKNKPIERIIISESAIDSLAKYQLEHKGTGPNTLYVATAGTVTERQVDLIQKIIDKQEPKQVVLANDNDAAGRRYNINYLNDLQPSRKAAEVEGHLTYAEGSRPVEFHATAAGKYHTALRVDIRHDNPQEGAQQLKQLTDRVRSVNGEQPEPTLTMEVQRSSAKETVVRIEAPNGDAAQLERIAQQLYQQREQARPEAERNPANFVKAEYAIAKDYGRDLELYAGGRSQQQVQEQASIEAAQRAQVSQDKQLAAERERQARELQEKEQRENSPEARAAREQANARASNALLDLAAAEMSVGSLSAKAVINAVIHPHAEAEIKPENRRVEVVMVSEPDTNRERQTPEPRYAVQLQTALEQQGAAVTVKPGLAVNYDGVVEHRVEVAYDKQAKSLEALSPTLDNLYKQPGVRVVESYGDSTIAERQQAVAGRERPVELPERPEPLTARVATLFVPEATAGTSERGLQVQAQLRAAGAEVSEIGAVYNVVNGNGTRVPVSYHVNQPELGAIDKTLNELKATGVQVDESYGASLNRQYIANNPEKAQQYELPSPRVQAIIPREIEEKVTVMLYVKEPLPQSSENLRIPYTESLRETLQQAGAEAKVFSPRPHLSSNEATLQGDLQVSFYRDQAGAATLSLTLDALSKEPGIVINEQRGPHVRQEYYAEKPGPALAIPEREEALSLRRATLSFPADNLQTAQETKKSLEQQGVTVSDVRSVEPAQFGVKVGGRSIAHEMEVAYRLDQAQLPAINAELTKLGQTGTGIVMENRFSANERLAAVEVQQRAQTQPAATLVVFVQPSPGRTNEDTIERLRAAGADAYATKEGEMVRVNIDTAKPGLVAINAELVKIENDARTRTGAGVVVETPDDRTQREAAVTHALRTAQPEVIRQHEQALEARTLTATIHTYPGTTQAETMERLRAAGAEAEPSRAGDMVRVHYNTGRPEIVAINAELVKINAESVERNGIPAVKELRDERALREAAVAAALSNSGYGQPIGPAVTSRQAEPSTEPVRATALTEAPTTRPAAPAAVELVLVNAPTKEGEPHHVGVEKHAIIKVDEQEPANGGKGRANAIADNVVASGAKVGTVHSETDSKGVRHSEMDVSYRTDQPEIGQVSKTLDAVARTNGVNLQEAPGDRGERQAAAGRQETARATEEMSR